MHADALTSGARHGSIQSVLTREEAVMVLKICTECRGQFPVPEQCLGQRICFSCHHWYKANQWLKRTIEEQRHYHPTIVSWVEGEVQSTAADFQRSIALHEPPLLRAHLPIRLVRFELRIIAANIDVVCGKLGKPARGTALFSQCEAEILPFITQLSRASFVWRSVCDWRKKFYDVLREVREEKHFRDAGRMQKTTAGA